MQRKQLRRSLELILTLLNPNQTENISLVDQIWIEENLEIVKKSIIVQGIGPYLFINRNQNSLTSTKLVDWLEKLYETNVTRIQCMHSELSMVLLQSNRLGIPVMPLKGSLLTTRYYPNPGIRPMADIDLLIKPEDFSGFTSILENLGYQLVASDTFYSNHYTYLKPENSSVVSTKTEHPDNPRPIEVHTELRRPLLGNSGLIDLTALIWQKSYTIDLFNQKAISPTTESLFIYLAIHAARHFFKQTGRILHWLDLALISDQVSYLLSINYSERIYLPLKLASRAFSGIFDLDDFHSFENTVDRRIRRWCTQVPLDDRCGLMINAQSPQTNRLSKMFYRWKPTNWKLIYTYGSIPLILAYLKYINSLVNRSHRLIR